MGHDEYDHLRESADADMVLQDGTLIDHKVGTQDMTPGQVEAYRAYMHDLDRQAAILLGEDPDMICALCGYVSHDEPTDADNTHDNLCCGVVGPCAYLAQDGQVCASH